MLEVNPDTVSVLINKAHVFHGKEGIINPDDTTSASGNLASDILTDRRDDTTFQEFKILVDDLEPDQQVALVALMWIGRGDFEPEEWDAALEQAREEWTPHTAEYLLSTPMLADYLEEGMRALGYS
jgi:hypothetical protein